MCAAFRRVREICGLQHVEPLTSQDAVGDGRVQEGGKITVTARLSMASSQDITISVSRSRRDPSINPPIVIPVGRLSGSTTLTLPTDFVDADVVMELPVVDYSIGAVDVTRSDQRFTVTVINSP